MREIQLYDAGLTSIYEISTKLSAPLVLTDVVSLHLHCNQITKIEGLDLMHNLRELNLSSNQIRVIEGLDTLTALEILDLASNKITEITGLASLTRLRRLVLAFNEITSLTGLTELHGPQYSLEYLDIRGNQLSSLVNVTNSLAGLVNLREVILEKSGKSNPVCRMAEYRPAMFAAITSLEILDGRGPATLRISETSTTRNTDDLRYPALEHYYSSLHSATTEPTQFDELVPRKPPRVDVPIGEPAVLPPLPLPIASTATRGAVGRYAEMHQNALQQTRIPAPAPSNLRSTRHKEPLETPRLNEVLAHFQKKLKEMPRRKNTATVDDVDIDEATETEAEHQSSGDDMPSADNDVSAKPPQEPPSSKPSQTNSRKPPKDPPSAKPPPATSEKSVQAKVATVDAACETSAELLEGAFAPRQAALEAREAALVAQMRDVDTWRHDMAAQREALDRERRDWLARKEAEEKALEKLKLEISSESERQQRELAAQWERIQRTEAELEATRRALAAERREVDVDKKEVAFERLRLEAERGELDRWRKDFAAAISAKSTPTPPPAAPPPPQPISEAEISRLRGELEQRIASEAEARSEATLQRRFAEFERERAARLEQDVATASTTAAKLKEDMHELAQREARAAAVAMELTNLVKARQMQLEEALQRADEAEQNVRLCVKDIKRLQRKLLAAEKMAAQKDDEIAALRKRVEELEAAAVSTPATPPPPSPPVPPPPSANYEEALRRANEEAQMATDAVKMLDKQLDDKNRTIAALRDVNADMEAKLKRERDAAAELSTQVRRLTDETAHLRAQLASSEQYIRHLEANVEDANGELRALRKKAREQQSQLADKDEQLQYLQDSLAEVEKFHARVTTRQKELEGELDRARKDCAEAQAAVASAIAAKEAKEAEAAACQQELAQLQAKMAVMLEDMGRQERKLKAIHKLFAGSSKTR